MLARRLLLILFLAAIAGAIGYGLMPAPVEADLAEVTIGEIRVTVDQDGKTRIRERYVVSAPLAGRLTRIDHDPGDAAVAGETLLASIEPRDPELLDDRAIAQAEARVKAAEANLQKMTPLLEEALAAQALSESELRRKRETRRKNTSAVSESEIERLEMTDRTNVERVRSARYAQEIAKFELDQAEAALMRSLPPESPTSGNNVGDSQEKTASNGRNFNIRSPINGLVLRVFQESSGFVNAGTNLLELGDALDLEVEIDVLSRDAVKIAPGATVSLEHWGGEQPLRGRVRLVEPSAFTKISTLGVEEQRVNVIVDLLDPPSERAELKDGYRVEARIVIAQASPVLKVPTSALFRIGDQWAAFAVVNGVVKERILKIGLQNGLEAEVIEGLEEGDRVVTHPSDAILAGVEVRERG
ncbi:MAG: HlyD family efflux transporter periplasmic adaptor subunit [Lacipirellulaceae bacterium]